MNMLTKIQTRQINRQIESHRHQKYRTNIVLSSDFALKGFVVEEKILRPEITTSFYLAKWLFANKKIYKNKKVLDMGCGSGIQGIVVGLFGARSVVSSDIDPIAVKSTKNNANNYHLNSKLKVIQSNLFKKIKSKFDLIIFNHPFFGDVKVEYSNLGRVNNGKLLIKFLTRAKLHLSKGGIIIMPYFHLAGQANDPGLRAPFLGYNVKVRLRTRAKRGIQKGLISIYELKLIINIS